MKPTYGDNSGFSLVELVVVIAIIGILSTIVTINFSDWQRKAAIERTTREMHDDLNQIRQRAMTHKKVHIASIGALGYVFNQLTSAADNGNAASSKILDRTLSYTLSDTSGAALSGLVVTFDESGYSNNATIVIGPAVSSAAVNCLTIHTARINIGKMNGGSCVFQ